MLATQTTSEAIVATNLPAAEPDTQAASFPLRVDRNRALVTRENSNGLHGLCEEGTLLLATNPTISTGMTLPLQMRTWADTSGMIYIYNNEAPGGRNIQLRYLKLITTAAGANATVWQYAAILDRAARFPTTNNTLVIVPVNPDGEGSNVADPTILFQNATSASVYPASSSAKRIVARGALGGLNVAGDVMYISFGQSLGITPALTAAGGATQSGSRAAVSPPISIPPGYSLLLSLWSGAITAGIDPEFEFLMSVW